MISAICQTQLQSEWNQGQTVEIIPKAERGPCDNEGTPDMDECGKVMDITMDSGQQLALTFNSHGPQTCLTPKGGGGKGVLKTATVQR